VTIAHVTVPLDRALLEKLLGHCHAARRQ